MSKNERFEDVIYAVEIYLPSDKSWHRQALDEDARANATHKDSLAVGDMAAMREALNVVIDSIRAFDKIRALKFPKEVKSALENMAFHAVTALAKPPRNCDIMDWRTAWAKWRTELHTQKPCGYAEVVSGTEQFMDWYMSEAKGENDGN